MDSRVDVLPREAGRRLDALVLERHPGSARRLVLEAVEGGAITLNGRRAAKGALLAAGDVVRIAALPERCDEHAAANPALALAILHEDGAVVVVNKPAGMPVHPLRLEETGTLANGLVARYPETAGLGDQPLFPGFVHRLDTDTSGVLLAARTPAAYAHLRRQFQAHTVGKRYVALVHGAVREDGEAVDWLAHEPGCPQRMVVVPDAKRLRYARPMRAVTRYAVRERLDGWTLLDVTIETGVTHQIRCQLAARGYAVAGDRIYAPAPAGAATRPPRQFLHAAELEFEHPDTGVRLRVAAPLPAELVEFLEAMRGRGQGPV